MAVVTDPEYLAIFLSYSGTISQVAGGGGGRTRLAIKLHKIY
jgi:hypothetical protein